MAEEKIFNKLKDKEETKSKKESVKKAEKIDTSNKTSNTGKSKPAFSFKKRNLIVILGTICFIFGILLVLAFFSYLFSWEIDQDRVMGKGLFSFLFEENIAPVDNFLGKFGAWFAHLFLYEWFGLSSFVFCFLFFLVGLRLMVNVRLAPILRSTVVTTVFMVWTSIFLGYFAENVNYLGGKFGYQVNQWLMLTTGKFGAFLIILGLFYIAVLTVFDVNIIRTIIDLIPTSKNDESIENSSSEEKPFTRNPLSENKTAIKETVIASKPNSYPSATTDSNEIEEDEADFEEAMLDLTIRSKTIDENEADEIVVDEYNKEIDLSKVNVIPEVSELEENFEVDGLSVNIAQAEEEVSESDLDKLRQEFGDYDPTLDLSSYRLPPVELLNDYGGKGITINKQELEDNKNRIVETLANYKIEISKIKATVGPTVTLYEIVPAPGVRISKIKNLEDDIALSLSALGIRIIAPIPGKGTIGIEVPNSQPDMVSMRGLIASEKFQNSDAELPVVLGKTITNETFTFDLTKTPHLLVAGATGQGKSVGLNAILVSILYKKHPSQVKFVLVDPKKVELTLYNKIERHFLAKLPGEADAIITDTTKVVNTLNSLCIEMDARYEILKDAQCRTIKEYNAKFIQRRLNPEKGHRFLPYIVVLIDEFADLIMTAGKEVEHPIARIAQLARAVGIHLIVATQRPSVNVITGMIKANFPARIAFRVLSKIDSRTILDTSGADQLIGRGDMLISMGSDVIRLQCGFVDTPEVEKICEFIGEQRGYPDAFILPEYVGEGAESGGDFDSDDLDPLFADAARIVVGQQQGSASLLQRKLKLGYNRAGRLVDQLEGLGIIGPFQGSKAREVLYVDLVQLEEFLNQKGMV